MAAGPNFANVPTTETALVSAANTNRDGSGTIVYSSAAPNQGRSVLQVVVTAIGTTTAGTFRMFVDNGTGGVGNARLYQEVVVTALVPAAGVIGFTYTFTLPSDGLPLPKGYRLGFCTNNAESFHVTMTQGDL